MSSGRPAVDRSTLGWRDPHATPRNADGLPWNSACSLGGMTFSWKDAEKINDKYNPLCVAANAVDHAVRWTGMLGEDENQNHHLEWLCGHDRSDLREHGVLDTCEPGNGDGV